MRTLLTTRFFGLAAVFLAVAFAPVQALASKVALVIGNGDYAHTQPLANPRNDAEAVAAKLRTLGFETIEGIDLTAAEMSGVAREFARAVRKADVAIFYYAGHGIQVDGKNYLIPVDARMDDELSIDFEAFPIDVVTDQMGYSKGANLVILDACRDNPFEENLARSMKGTTRSIGGGGLSEMNVQDNGAGTGIVFATQPGNVALDGDGKHSPFTEAFLNHVGTPNVPITTLMLRITGDVFRATDEQQRPWFNQSFTDEVFLYQTALAPATDGTQSDAGQVPLAQPASPCGSEEDDRYMFELARESGDISDYEAYLDFCPNGRYARFARIAIERIEAEEVAEAGTNVASLGNAVDGGASTRALPGYDESAPLVLPVTDKLRVTPSSQVSEQALQMDRNKKREVQARLNASGHNVGVTDGLFGPGTRRGVSDWQASNGLPATGYLNGLQLSLLTSQTEATYASFLTQSNTARTSTSSSGNVRRNNAGGTINEAAREFIRGVGQGTGNALGNRLFGN